MISQISDHLKESQELFPHICRVKITLELYENGPNGCHQIELSEINNKHGMLEISGFDRNDCIKKTMQFIEQLSKIGRG